MESKWALFDIAANLTNERFQGKYNGKKKHLPDIDTVVARARKSNVTNMIVSATQLSDFGEVLSMAKKYDNTYCTFGIHPCTSNEYIKKNIPIDEYFKSIEKCIQEEMPNGKLVAIGECGLDYDRLFCSPKEHQNKVFPFHFALSEKYKLPLYLHSRNTNGEFASK